MFQGDPMSLQSFPIPDFSDHALAVLHSGKILADDESPANMIERVVKSVVQVERRFGTSALSISSLEYGFADCMARKLFILGSPILTNAGRFPDRALGSCVAIPVNLRQSFSSIRPTIEAYYEQNMGSGFDLSEVPDPIDVLSVLNEHAASETVASKYERYIGNMANLDVDHPSVQEFATFKTSRALPHFNLSINVTDAFMHALIHNEPFRLKDGSEVNPTTLWSKIGLSAWRCGDPGLLFMDRFNSDNPTPSVGAYTTTAPCAEVGLAPGESCVFGYLNLGQFIRVDSAGVTTFDFDHLVSVIPILTRVLDDALEISLTRYPSLASRQIMRSKRKIGIGICGFADLLIRLHLPYDAPEAITLLQNILVTISFYSKVASVELARKRGSFRALTGSRYMTEDRFLSQKYGSLLGLRVSPSQWRELECEIRNSGHLRHSSTTALPPSGRSALILDASTSLEPWFSLFNGSGGLKSEVVSLIIEQCGEAAPLILQQVEKFGTCQIPGLVPDAIRETVKCALEISPTTHLAVVAAASRCVDEAASKTINLPRHATVDVISDIYLEAWYSGLKAISVYRDGSRLTQPETFQRKK